MPESSTLYQRIREHATHTPHAVALLAPGREPLTYAGLLRQLSQTMESLNRAGIGRHDRMALVLPNGPELATAFLSVLSCATAAPLNPAYRADEFEFYLSDLRAKALIVPANSDSPAVAVARALDICIVRLEMLDSDPAGCFTLHLEPGARASAPGPAQPEDTALVLHTSGTTSRPKIVPQLQSSIAISAANVAESLRLTPDDRCLNIMPLFHVHGLIGALLSSMWAGASVVCSPGFYAPRFFEWLDELRPTWYTAVPTMHQSILERAADQADVIERRPLRLIRSCSAAMPPQIIRRLEDVFDAPVVEAYGMTEACHQMSINPLPPGARKPTSVGLPTGPEMGIMGRETDEFLAPGETGEIVIKGATVTRGYENNPEANASAFVDGWFRTGDEGRMDEDGYFYVTGRIKEIINRGGEKISPREVDEVLLAHPGVAQAVTFAMPHPRLGEDVAAAVVPTQGAEPSEQDLRRFASARLAAFKVPNTIVFLTEIPKGPTGKLQRIGLAESLGVTADGEESARVEYAAPRSRVEQRLVDIWARVLDVDPALIGVNHRFEDLGGDSLLALLVVNEICDAFKVDVELIDVLNTPTIASISELVQEKLGSPD